MDPEFDDERTCILDVVKKSALLSKAAEVIAPLQDAIDLDEATSKEIADLKVWKKYRVLVNRVDVTNPEWPEEPQ
ncbi:tail fiber assembly protein [Serratia nevei]